jgi:saccharopine dehydrogenase (NAD+, L-lysine-forming)
LGVAEMVKHTLVAEASMASIVVVGGAGHMGRRAVRALVESGHTITVADRVAPEGEGFEFAQIDARDPSTLLPLFERAEAVMNFAGPFYAVGPVVLQAAIDSGRPYLDICDDADATELLLELGPAAEERGVCAVVGAGMSPGVLNAVGVIACRGLSQIDELVLTWVVGEGSAGGVAPLIHYFHCIDGQIPVWEEGRRALVDGFSPQSAENFPFPEPVGTTEVRDVGHPESVTLPRVLKASRVHNKGAILPASSTPIFETLRRLELLGSGTVQIEGVEVQARDFVARFLQERHNQRARPASEDTSAFGVRVTGSNGGGARVERVIGHAQYATMADNTALPAVAGMPQLLESTPAPGVHGPEVLDPVRWFDQLYALAPELFREFHLSDHNGESIVLSLRELAAWQPS